MRFATPEVLPCRLASELPFRRKEPPAMGQESVMAMQAACEMILPNILTNVQEEWYLTALDRRIIALVSAAYTNKQIARRLQITENAAKLHLARIFDKLEVSNRVELVLFALDQGLTEED
jgi:DNA-binding CsgD family transcriptional regulator